MSCEADQLTERLLKCLEEIEDLQDELEGKNDLLASWTGSLEELYDIADAFEVDEKNKLQGNTILDIGTDCVKSLCIALKLEPSKIVGINEDFLNYSVALEIEKASKFLTETKIQFYVCSLFDKEKLMKILKGEDVKKFNYILLSKTLHHLRTGKDCVADKRDQNHECRKDEKYCINKFEPEEIFEDLLEYGDRVIIYEASYPQEEDEGKVRGRGGYFTIEEWIPIFEHLSEKYSVQFIKPRKYRLAKSKIEEIKSELRKVDLVCFYVEAK